MEIVQKKGWCMMMLGMMIDNRTGLPSTYWMNGEGETNNYDGECGERSDIMGFTDDMVKELIEMLHYQDLVAYNRAIMEDARSGNDSHHYLDEFKATHEKSPTPLHMISLYEFIVKGHVYFAIERTDCIIAIYVGTDLTKPFKQRINRCKAEGICTYSVTQKARTRQYPFRCSTCFPGDDSMVICEPCAVKCHKGHNVFVRTNSECRFEKSLMFCDCGDVLDCQCLK